MHARRERRIDRIFRVRCKVCGRETMPALEGDYKAAAEAGGPVELPCLGDCRARTEHEVVRP